MSASVRWVRVSIISKALKLMVPDIVGRKKMLFSDLKKNQTPIKFLFFNSNPLVTNDSIKVLKNLFHGLIFIDPFPPL